MSVIPAGKPESSHMDVKLSVGSSFQLRTCNTAKLPSMALDTGFLAGMTAMYAGLV